MSELTWPDGSSRAISLAFMNISTDAVPAVLEQLGELRATFFVNPTEVLRDAALWQSVATLGHEIANGCLADATDDGDLPNWTLRSIEQELFMAQTFFDDLFAEQETRTFAYPGIGHQCADGSYCSVVTESFPFALSPLVGVNGADVNLNMILSSVGDTAADGWHVVRIDDPTAFTPLDFESAWVAPIGTVAEKLLERR